MAVETRVVKDNDSTRAKKWRVDMRNVDKGIGWTVFRRFGSLKSAAKAAEIMAE